MDSPAIKEDTDETIVADLFGLELGTPELEVTETTAASSSEPNADDKPPAPTKDLDNPPLPSESERFSTFHPVSVFHFVAASRVSWDIHHVVSELIPWHSTLLSPKYLYSSRIITKLC